jgi:hypothetical protein
MVEALGDLMAVLTAAHSLHIDNNVILMNVIDAFGQWAKAKSFFDSWEYSSMG